MILSFHPCFEGDRNILCAGREPDENDLAAVKTAEAVILPQGCRRSLFEMAREHAHHVFPNYEARFRYPGKIGQIHLFQNTGTLHPRSQTYASTNEFPWKSGAAAQLPGGFRFPVVFKFDWGGEGDTVFFLQDPSDLHNALTKARTFEVSGQTGFLIQQYVPANHRVLRVAVIGKSCISYWRVQNDKTLFEINLAKGAVIDATSDPHLRRQGIQAVRDLCRSTGINLAGFDLLFPAESIDSPPCFLEINYYFGRKGLGGSERFYALLAWQIRKWIKTLPKSMNPGWCDG